MRLFPKTATQLCGAMVLAALSTYSMASGYHFGAQSVSGLSAANANAAEAADASTIFHNPAGLTHLPGGQVSINTFVVLPSVKYYNARGQYFVTHAPIQGETSGKISSAALVPQMYASYQINNQITAGLGFYIPFASGTEYSHNSVLRYNVNETELTTFDINPTIAFKLNEQHSFGVGLIAQHTNAKLRQYADFMTTTKLQTAGLAQTGNATAIAQVGGGLLSSNAMDGYASLKGNDWGIGFNWGWLWNINDRARVGVSYRSAVKHTLKGDGEWRLTGAAFADPTRVASVRGAGYVAKEDVSVKITTPESLSFHGMFVANPKLNLFGDITWTRHSRFNSVNIMWQNPKGVVNASTVPPSSTRSNQTNLRPNWKNTWKFAVGASYQLNDPLQLRAGLSYDQSPVKNANDRLSTMPDNDRITLGLGAKYDFSKRSSVNLAYAFTHIKKATANVNGWCGSMVELGAGARSCVSTRTSGSANFKAHAHTFGAQYTYRFK